MKTGARFNLLCILGVLALTVAACGGGSGDGGGGATASADLAAGKDLYGQSCAVCHGMNGEGMPALGKDLRGNEFVAAHSDAELVAFIKEGRPANHPDNTQGVDMPPNGGNPAYTEDDLAQIVAYMRTLK